MAPRTPAIHKSLAVLLQSMVDMRIIVELKNDVEITGILQASDIKMNIEMIDVQYITPHGKIYDLEICYTMGRNIRYVHIPNKIDVTKNLTSHLKKLQLSKLKYSRQTRPRPQQSKNIIRNFATLNNNTTGTGTGTGTNNEYESQYEVLQVNVKRDREYEDFEYVDDDDDDDNK